IGAGSGLVLGYASGDDDEGFFSFTKEEKTLYGAIFSGLSGMVIGFLAGLKKKVILLEGSKEKYRRMRLLITRYSLTGH
ncbi:MAG: hypothetical protein U0U46_21760, partial [Saprospiraceae bacterium]